MNSLISSKAGKKRSATLSAAHRIVVIDDHPLVRQGLAQLLGSRPDLSIVGSAESASEGIEMVRAQKPDLVICDLSLARGDGLELVKQLKSEMPRLPVLVISMHDESVYADRVLRAGARGYLMKKEPSEKVFEAIRHLLQGEIYVSDRIKREMLEFSIGGKKRTEEADSVIERLTDRELQVFRLLGNGLPTREIAAQLHLSVKTIETYRENLKVKLNLTNGALLVQRAVQWSRTQPTA